MNIRLCKSMMKRAQARVPARSEPNRAVHMVQAFVPWLFRCFKFLKPTNSKIRAISTQARRSNQVKAGQTNYQSLCYNSRDTNDYL